MVVLSLAGTLVLYGVPDSSAQKKLTYEQADARCKEDIVRTFPPGSTSTSGRYARGGAYMKQFGYNLKKGANF